MLVQLDVYIISELTVLFYLVTVYLAHVLRITPGPIVSVFGTDTKPLSDTSIDSRHYCLCHCETLDRAEISPISRKGLSGSRH